MMTYNMDAAMMLTGIDDYDRTFLEKHDISNLLNVSQIPSTTPTPDYTPGLEPVNWTKVVFTIIICIVGLLGNTISVFVIIVLKEYKKSITHMYVLQLAVADSVFLMTLPFKASEDIHSGWLFPEWMCKAKETILFLNYYASILFLMVMSIDRYIAVCHTFSDNLLKLRKPFSATVIVIATWILSLLICIPVIMYSTTVGTSPHCRCTYSFPDVKNFTEICTHEFPFINEQHRRNCVRIHEEFETKPKCASAEILQAQINMIFELQLGGSGLLGNGSVTDTGSLGFGGGDFYENYSEVGYEGYEGEEYDYRDYGTTGARSGNGREGNGIGDLGSHSSCNYWGKPPGWTSFLYFNFIVMFMFPLIVMVVTYGLIIRKLRTNHVRTPSNNRISTRKGRANSSGGSGRKKHRVTIMCFTLVVAFILCWLPFHVGHLAKINGIMVPFDDSDICRRLSYAGSLLGYLNSALNPYLYSFIGTNFIRRWASATGTIRKSLSSRPLVTQNTAKYHRKSRDGSSSNAVTMITKVNRQPSNSDRSGMMVSEVTTPKAGVIRLNSSDPKPSADDRLLAGK